MAQDRFTVAFSKNEVEQKLYEWIKEQAIIVGPSVFTKQILYKAMIEDQEEKNNKKS